MLWVQRADVAQERRGQHVAIPLRKHFVPRLGGHKRQLLATRRNLDTYALEREPVKRERAEVEKVRPIGDLGKVRAAGQLDRNHSVKCREIELEALHESRQIRDHKNRFFLISPDESENLAVFGIEELHRPAAECLEPSAHRDEPLCPP